MTTAPDAQADGLTADEIIQIEQDVLDDAKDAELEEQIKTRRAARRLRLAKILPNGTHEFAGNKVVVSQNRDLDTKAIERDFPITQHHELYTAKIDRDKVRRHIPPAVLDEQYTTLSPKRVAIR